MLWEQEINRLWRAPDKPNRCSPSMLHEWEERGTFVIEEKADGHRGVLFFDEKGVMAVSRHFRSLDVSTEMLRSLVGLLPHGSALDVEWMGRRAEVGHEAIRLIDVLYWEWQWQGSRGLLERTAIFPDLNLPENVSPVERRSSDFLGFFRDQIGSPTSEGVVVKRVGAKLKGKATSAKNPGWFKVKWRDGPGGDVQVVTREDVDALIAAI